MRFKFFSSSKEDREPRRVLEAPLSYRLSYASSESKAHGICYSKDPNQISGVKEGLGPGFDWVLEMGQEGFWERLETGTTSETITI